MSPEKTRIWRMTYYRNIGFILRKGLHCCNCGVQDPEYVNIGHKSLIDYRGQSPIDQPPGGVLNDYIPFYFSYKMPMLHKIHKGQVKDYAGTQDEIIYILSSVEKIIEMKLPFLFTDRHAYLATKTIFNSYESLKHLRWDIIKDDAWFKHAEYSDLKELKQAEFLVHRQLPAHGILGIVAHNDEIATFVRNQIAINGFTFKVIVNPAFYYL